MLKPVQYSVCGSFLLFAATPAFAQTNSSTMPEVVVTGTAPAETRPGWLAEEQPIGNNQQPEWTTQRRFATTRIYVAPPGQIEFEQWWKGKFARHGSAIGESEHLWQTEISVGLPYRFQLDLYQNTEMPAHHGLRTAGQQVELRWAFADWGKIPLNPTLYGEWKFNAHDEPDAYEIKLLLGEDFATRWHWGFNIFFEQQVGGGRESEMGFAQGISYSLVDGKLSAGVEMQLERASGPNLDGKPATEFLIGPSLQWRFCPRTHLDFVPLFGCTDDSPAVEAFIVFGIDLGREQKSARAPVSTRSR